MFFFLPLLLGYCIAVLAVILPGLINMTAAKISLQEGRNEALSFAVGASLVVFIQTYIAVLFARFISIHLEIISLIQEIGIFIFSCLSIYFFWLSGKAHQPKTSIKLRGKTNRFYFGLLLSMLNFLPVPFYVFTSISLAGAGYFHFERMEIMNFVTGVMLGSLSVFYLYIAAFKLIESRTSVLVKNMNIIIGSISAVIAVFTLLKLLYP